MRSFVVALVVVAIPAGNAVGQLLWFNNADDFVSEALGRGKILRGVEDFEESVVLPGRFVAFDDPLESGVPNEPDGFPFPKGLTGLDDIKVQSNTLGGQPSRESPRGSEGLVAAAVGDRFVSDVVLANYFIDSWDLVFLTQANDTAVGANTINAARGISVDIRVYDKENRFLGMNTFRANSWGHFFFGVVSDDLIGRINVFSPGNGAEGLDNIQAWAPEPGTLSLLAFAMLALGSHRRRIGGTAQ